MTTDPIDVLLRADEEELKAKRARLRTFARSVDAAREAISAAQDSGQAIASSDGLSRADVARTFGLSSAEKALLLPSRRRSRGASADGVDESHEPDTEPDDSLHQQRADGDDAAHEQHDQLDQQ